MKLPGVERRRRRMASTRLAQGMPGEKSWGNSGMLPLTSKVAPGKSLRVQKPCSSVLLRSKKPDTIRSFCAEGPVRCYALPHQDGT